MKRLMLLLISVLLCAGASAQRTMNTQYFIGAQGVYSSGVELSLGQYQNFGYWEVALQGTLGGASLTTGEHFSYGRAQARGDYMFRFLNTRSRGLNFYAGAGLLLGYELADVYGTIPSDAETDLVAGSFIYGGYPKVTVEIFPIRRVALTVGAEMDIVLGSQFLTLMPKGMAGLRFML